jgi:hypothetical protein
MTLSTTIFSSPVREDGIQGGKAAWRGNHPPTLSRDVFEWLKPKMVADPMCGSVFCKRKRDQFDAENETS